MRVSQEEVAAHEKNCVSKNDAAAGQKSKFFVSFVYTEDKKEKRNRGPDLLFKKRRKKRKKGE